MGAGLYRCGNAGCAFSAPQVSDFRDHLLTCELSVDQMYLACFHCDKQFKHVPTLMEHLKTHGVRRYESDSPTLIGFLANFNYENRGIQGYSGGSDLWVGLTLIWRVYPAGELIL